MGILASVYLSVHTPRYCTLEAAVDGKLASEAFRPVRDGLVAQGNEVARARLDVMVVNSCHLITTFPTVVDGTPRHRGVLTAQEAPEIIHGVAYDYPGDYELAAAIIGRGGAAGLQCVLANDVHYPLDYGTVMPMVCYLDRAQRLPVVPVSICLAADLEESFEWGRHIARAARESGKRVGSSPAAASHKLVRGPSRGPSPPTRSPAPPALAKMLAAGEYRQAWEWLPEVRPCRRARDGRPAPGHDAGGHPESAQGFEATVHAYGPFGQRQLRHFPDGGL
jgi:3,4-dihydroxyphenylacetate 2,3-dioxygenase